MEGKKSKGWSAEGGKSNTVSYRYFIVTTSMDLIWRSLFTRLNTAGSINNLSNKWKEIIKSAVNRHSLSKHA